MILFHPDGEALDVDDGRWWRALSVAREHGWKPLGTRPPPSRLDGSACAAERGSYWPAIGQEVVQEDAQGLAKALGAAHRTDWLVLRDFCHRGGFVICQIGADESPGGDLLRLDRRLRQEASGRGAAARAPAA